MILWILSSILVIFMGMGGVAFVTLLERKVLGLSQIRLGPSKTTLWGFLQPMADGVKLLSKQNTRNIVIQFSIFFMSPLFLFVFFLFIWSWVLTWEGNCFFSKNNSLLYFSLLGLSAYSVIMVGWSSTSVFSKMGSMRGILQSLSYEVALIILFIFLLFFYKSLNLTNFDFCSKEMLLFWIIVWVILALMESNRAPFDLLEGESELISGFNIEMGSILFVYLFLSEYGMLIVMAMITNAAVMSVVNYLSFVLVIVMLLMRSCFPRMRYDSLMGMMWQSILPISVLISFFMVFQ